MSAYAVVSAGIFEALHPRSPLRSGLAADVQRMCWDDSKCRWNLDGNPTVANGTKYDMKVGFKKLYLFVQCSDTSAEKCFLVLRVGSEAPQRVHLESTTRTEAVFRV